jgi:hypothetical protein
MEEHRRHLFPIVSVSFVVRRILRCSNVQTRCSGGSTYVRSANARFASRPLSASEDMIDCESCLVRSGKTWRSALTQRRPTNGRMFTQCRRAHHSQNRISDLIPGRNKSELLSAIISCTIGAPPPRSPPPRSPPLAPRPLLRLYTILMAIAEAAVEAAIDAGEALSAHNGAARTRPRSCGNHPIAALQRSARRHRVHASSDPPRRPLDSAMSLKFVTSVGPVAQ